MSKTLTTTSTITAGHIRAPQISVNVTPHVKRYLIAISDDNIATVNGASPRELSEPRAWAYRLLLARNYSGRETGNGYELTRDECSAVKAAVDGIITPTIEGRVVIKILPDSMTIITNGREQRHQSPNTVERWRCKMTWLRDTGEALQGRGYEYETTADAMQIAEDNSGQWAPVNV